MQAFKGGCVLLQNLKMKNEFSFDSIQNLASKDMSSIKPFPINVKDIVCLKKQTHIENGTVTLVNRFSQHDTKASNFFVIPSKGVKNACPNPKCIKSACPTHLQVQMEKYQKNKGTNANASTAFFEKIIDEQQCSSITHHYHKKINKLSCKQDLLIKTTKEHNSLLPFQDKPVAVMKVVQEPVENLLPISTQFMQTSLETPDSKPYIVEFFKIDKKREKPKMIFFLNFPFHCDSSCLNINSVWKSKAEEYHSLTSVSELSDLFILGKESYDFSKTKKESCLTNPSTINYRLVKWDKVNIADKVLIFKRQANSLPTVGYEPKRIENCHTDQRYKVCRNKYID